MCQPQHHRPALALLFAAALLLSGCADSAHCDAGWKLEGGACAVDPGASADLAGDPDSDGSATVHDSGDGDDRQADSGDGTDSPTDSGDGNDDGDQTSGVGDGEGFGVPCTDGVNHSDCNDSADYCAVMPGATSGYCTVSECVDDDSACPDGWSCFDLSGFGANLSFCTENP